MVRNNQDEGFKITLVCGVLYGSVQSEHPRLSYHFFSRRCTRCKMVTHGHNLDPTKKYRFFPEVDFPVDLSNPPYVARKFIFVPPSISPSS